MSAQIVIETQWDDFLLRANDPYAFAKYEILLTWLGSSKNKNVLVIGSGSGEFAIMLAQQGAKVTAIDISEKYVSLTRANAEKENVPLTCLVATIEDFKPNQLTQPAEATQLFDIVIATDVIEHIKDDSFAIKKMATLMKKDGTLIITVPALQFLFGHHDVILGHFRRYSKRTLQKVCEQFFTTSKLRYFGFFLIPVALLFSRIIRKSYPVGQVGSRKGKLSLVSWILNWLLWFEKKIPLPLGTSVLLMATKKS